MLTMPPAHAYRTLRLGQPGLPWGSASGVAGPAPRLAPQSAPAGRMTRPPSLLFDLEMELENNPSPMEGLPFDAVRGLERLTHRPEAHLAQVADVVHHALSDLRKASSQPDLTTLERALRRRGCVVSVERCEGGASAQRPANVSAACLHTLRHAFLRGVSPAGHRYVVDTAFRDQFQIPQATPRYAAVLSRLPSVFVGSEDLIRSLVEVMCGEMRLAFKAHGSLLPPWRQADSILSKWGLKVAGGAGEALGGGAAAAPEARFAGAAPRAPAARGGAGEPAAALGGAASIPLSGVRVVPAEPAVRVVGGNFVDVPTALA